MGVKPLLVTVTDVEATVSYTAAFDESPVLVGRGVDVSLRLDREHVSAHHATIVFDDQHIAFADLDSRNGSVVDGVVYDGGQAVELGESSVVRIGNLKLTFSRDATKRPPADTANPFAAPEGAVVPSTGVLTRDALERIKGDFLVDKSSRSAPTPITGPSVSAHVPEVEALASMSSPSVSLAPEPAASVAGGHPPQIDATQPLPQSLVEHLGTRPLPAPGASFTPFRTDARTPLAGSTRRIETDRSLKRDPKSPPSRTKPNRVTPPRSQGARRRIIAVLCLLVLVGAVAAAALLRQGKPTVDEVPSPPPLREAKPRDPTPRPPPPAAASTPTNQPSAAPSRELPDATEPVPTRRKRPRVKYNPNGMPMLE